MVEFILQNYIWFLGVAILILLAIIGSYAEKTNFGQPRSNNKKTKTNLVDTNKIGINDAISKKEIKINLQKTKIKNVNEKLILNNNIKKISISDDSKKLDKQIFNNDKAQKFEREFNELLPKKEVIEDDLLFDIDNMSLEKTQRYSFKDIPDLDDVDLPSIKNKAQIDEDIWKL